MFEEFEQVKILSTGEIGTIVDKVIIDGQARYVVESDTYDNPSGKPYGGTWPLYDCVDADLARVQESETA